MLYTDGVVERRRESLDIGLDRLAQIVTTHADEPLEHLADTIVEQLCADPDDDCCILLLRRTNRGNA